MSIFLTLDFLNLPGRPLLQHGVEVRERMQLLGLRPSASSSSAPRRHGSIPTAGNTLARRVLVEGAWAYRSPAKGGRHLPLRLENQPHSLQDISWQAQVRLCKRYRRLVARGQPAYVVTVAMASARTGFMGAMATEAPLAVDDHIGARWPATLRVGLSTVHRTRQRFVEEGLATALTERRRPGTRQKLDGKQEAFLVAPACSTPPAGRKRWTMPWLADRLIALQLVEAVSDETVRRVLKNALKLWQRKEWCLPSVSSDFVWHMEDVLDLYGEPYAARRP